MKKFNYREIFIFIMVFILLIVLCMVYIFRKDDTSVEKNLKISKEDITVSIDNSQPVSDDIGITKTYTKGQVKFSIDASDIKKDKIKYEITIKQTNTIDSINANYIKVYLENDNIKAPLFDRPEVFNNLKSAESDIEARRLYEGDIKKNQKVDLKFKMWVSDSYTINSKNKQFDVKIEVRTIK